MGRNQFALHYEGNAPIVQDQSDMTPMQRRFIEYGLSKYGPEEPDTNGV